MDFNERLKNYRISLKIKKKREMADKIGISEQLYYMLESGTRKPSKDVLEKLFLFSEKPEEYWLYGITDDNEYIEKREEFKCMNDAIEQLSNLGLLGLDKEYSDGVKEVLLAAAIADTTHILEKRHLLKINNIKGV
jgi:transcriptional regulator with XRE-family HTH domain